MIAAGKVLAEMAGTFAIILIGGGSILLSEKFPNFFPSFGVAVTFGVIITLMILIFGGLSGAHFNPAVTLAFAVTKRIPAGDIPIYFLGQCTGGLLAGIFLVFLKKI